MIITNNSRRCIRVEDIVLKPGNNLLNEEQEAIIKSSIGKDESGESKFVTRLIDNKVLKVPTIGEEKGEPKKATKVKKIGDLKSKDAIEIINSTFDLDALETFNDEESSRDKPRVGVIRAIESQIDKIESKKGEVIKDGEDEETFDGDD